MDTGDDELFTESMGAWSLAYSRQPSDAGVAPLAVDISRDGRGHARLVLAKQGLSQDAAAEALRERARAWIKDYEGREHSGDTGFASL